MARGLLGCGLIDCLVGWLGGRVIDQLPEMRWNELDSSGFLFWAEESSYRMDTRGKCCCSGRGSTSLPFISVRFGRGRYGIKTAEH